jgi:hypothetical protein
VLVLLVVLVLVLVGRTRGGVWVVVVALARAHQVFRILEGLDGGSIVQVAVAEVPQRCLALALHVVLAPVGPQRTDDRLTRRRTQAPLVLVHVVAEVLDRPAPYYHI